MDSSKDTLSDFCKKSDRRLRTKIPKVERGEEKRQGETRVVGMEVIK